MQTNALGWTGLQLSRLGLGTWAMGGGGWQFGWGPQDSQESIRTIYRALDLGINWIDTAPAYGLGQAESVIGTALKGMAQRPLLATKCGRSWDAQGRLVPALNADVVRAELEASLRRLQTETIDLYQIHWPQPATDVPEAWGVIAEAIQAGKVRYAGVSNFSVPQLEALAGTPRLASLQPPYSLLDREVERRLLPYCHAHQLGVVSYSPLQKGLLTGAFSRERLAQLPADDHRHRDPRFQEPLLSAHLALVEDLAAVARPRGRTVAQLAIAWVRRRPEVTSVIVGARQPAQLEATVAAAECTLAPAELAAIEQALDARLAGPGRRD